MGGKTCNAVGGGKKCFAVFSGDLAPGLIALRAKVTILSARGERRLLLSDFYTGDGAKPLAIKPDEILSGVEVPMVPEEAFTNYFKYRIRKSIDFPLASLATRLIFDRKKKVCREAKVVIGAVNTRPEELKEIENLLQGRKIESSLIEEASELAFKAAKPIANAGSSPSYRKRVIKLFVKKALEQGLRESV